MLDSIQSILVSSFIPWTLSLLISLGFSILCGVLRNFHMGYGAVFIAAVDAMLLDALLPDR